MLRRLIEWAVHNRLVVILLAISLIGVGAHSLININIEAYPDPAPAIAEVIAQYPGASAEEVERQVTVPLEVALSGMPKLKSTPVSRCLDWLISATSSITARTSIEPRWRCSIA